MRGLSKGAVRFDWFDVRVLEALLTAGLVLGTVVTAMALAGVSSIGSGGLVTSVPVEVDLDPAKVAPELARTLPEGIEVEGVRATMSTEPSDLWEHVLARLQLLPVLLLALFAIVLVRRIVRSVSAGDPFVPENVRRLRIIGWLVAALPWVLLIAQIARSELVARSAVADLAVVSMTFAFLPILIGALLLVLAEVFAAGVRLRQDTEGLV